MVLEISMTKIASGYSTRSSSATSRGYCCEGQESPGHENKKPSNTVCPLCETTEARAATERRI